MATAEFDLRRLKQLVSIEQVLQQRGLLGSLRRRAGQLVGPCPIHGGDNPTAFVVCTRRNIWRCFTRCDRGGDLVEFVRLLESGSYRDAALYLAALAHTGEESRVTVIADGAMRDRRPFKAFTSRLKLDPDTPFLRHKGIRPETAKRWEVGAYAGGGLLAGCVAVRLRDPSGQVLGYAGRRLDPESVATRGKWVFPPGLEKGSLLYGYQQAKRTATCVVTECPWGVLRLDQIGVPAVALLGCRLSGNQLRLLNVFERVVVLLDGDPAGRQAAETLRDRLPTAVIAELPDGLDPDDMNDLQLARLTSVTQ